MRTRRPGKLTWEGHPREAEYRLQNDGLGMCNTGPGRPNVCVLGGSGCDIDHVAIARENLRRLRRGCDHRWVTPPGDAGGQVYCERCGQQR